MSVSNDIYILPRDAQETKRLDEQHHYLLRCFPFHIHPAIPVNVDMPDLRIADIACGSGIWLAEVAQMFPNAECHGFDISGEQFPSEAQLDEKLGRGRVRFHVEDAASEDGPAQEFRGTFDVVAIRLLHVSLIGEAWIRAVRNIVAMLKPGGYIQWIDWDPRTAYLVQYKPLARRAAMVEMLSGWNQFLATRDTGVADRLGDLLLEAEMCDVLRERYGSDPDMETRDWIMWTLLDSVPIAIRKSLIGKEGSSWSEERLQDLVRQMKEERAAGECFLRFNMNCFVARKPS